MGGGYNETVVGAIGDWAISREAGQYGRGGVRWEADGALGELAAPTELHSILPFEHRSQCAEECRKHINKMITVIPLAFEACMVKKPALSKWLKC